MKDIVSTPLLLSFVLLGIFPLLAQKTLRFIRKGKIYKGHSKPRSFDCNLVVIGAGAAGLVGASIASAVKTKVTLIESTNAGKILVFKHDGVVKTLHLLRCCKFLILTTYPQYTEKIKNSRASNMKLFS